MATVQDARYRIKANLAEAVPASLIARIVHALGLTTRERQLTPVVTTHLAIQRWLHGGTAMTHLRRFTDVPFSPSAYCQAIQRLPVAFFGLLTLVVTGRLRSDRPADRWHGHRVVLLDGSGLSMPDTPALQQAFGQPSGQKPGCGFPVAHQLAMFDYRTGYLVRTTLGTADRPSPPPADIDPPSPLFFARNRSICFSSDKSATSAFSLATSAVNSFTCRDASVIENKSARSPPACDTPGLPSDHSQSPPLRP